MTWLPQTLIIGLKSTCLAAWKCTFSNLNDTYPTLGLTRVLRSIDVNILTAREESPCILTAKDIHAVLENNGGVFEWASDLFKFTLPEFPVQSLNSISPVNFTMTVIRDLNCEVLLNCSEAEKLEYVKTTQETFGFIPDQAISEEEVNQTSWKLVLAVGGVMMIGSTILLNKWLKKEKQTQEAAHLIH